jgi:hypothetical protein
MLFGRGQWAIFGVEAKTLANFQKALADPKTIFEVSQLAASITTKFQSQPMTGINPFGNPRLDEQLTDPQIISEISETLVKMDAGDEVTALPDCLNYVGAEVDFSLGNNKYGFWMVSNEYEDPTDPNSKKEQIAYTDRERPYKFLIKEEKKSIDDQVTAQAVLNRSQYPVLVDFQNERVYVASSNKDEVIAVQELLTKLGAKCFPLVWDFKYPTWPGEFLNRVAKETHFSSQMKERADELSRFRPDEVQKLDDKQLEKIVSTYFALSPLDSELWAGLSTPARIRLHKAFDPVGVSNPSVAFSLLGMSNDAEIASASVVFQELKSKFTKAGEEKVYRNDLFTIDINDNANLQDAGAAMLRGFDLPQFKKEVKTTIKAKGRIAIRDFWALWLQGLNDSVLEFVDNVNDVLGLEKAKYGLKVVDLTSSEVEVSEE